MNMEQAKSDILAAISARVGQRDFLCLGCGGGVWSGPEMFAIAQVELTPGAGMQLQPTGNVSPIATLCCDGCGYIVSYNLVKLGLWAKWESQSLVVPQGMGPNGHRLEIPGMPQFPSQN